MNSEVVSSISVLQVDSMRNSKLESPDMPNSCN
jgi:hypothetical protein